jgi:hypothetical protein
MIVLDFLLFSWIWDHVLCGCDLLHEKADLTRAFIEFYSFVPEKIDVGQMARMLILWIL